MKRTAHIDLPDGRRLDYIIRTSARSKSISIRLSVRNGMVVTAPLNIETQRITKVVADKQAWIIEKLKKFDSVRHFINENGHARPQSFSLPSVGESWQVEYQATRIKTVGARTDKVGRVIVYGAIENQELCHAALRRWLARRAKDALFQWLDNLAEDTGLQYGKLIIRNQKTRWGSCSASHLISLNCKLLFLPKELVRYVLIHELCHTVELNHSARFWSMVRQYEPKLDDLHGKIRDAWKQIPAWAHPFQISRDKGL
ncbi:MAG: M48 family metallopeptidase [Desulfamplus sp.]|nr:M48 family metallopeptidase [Desulfamplus sp.]